MVTYEELDRRALALDSAQFRGLRLQEAIYEARKAALDALIADHLLELEAKRAGESPQALLDRELRSGATTITENDVRAWYEANQSRVKGASFEAAAADIRRLLEGQQRNACGRICSFGCERPHSLGAAANAARAVQVAADEPRSGPVGCAGRDRHVLDFQCPVLREVGDRRAIETEVRREAQGGLSGLPAVSSHPQAEQAAIAARCAHEQGRFWEFHDRIFALNGTSRRRGSRSIRRRLAWTRSVCRMPAESAHAGDRQRNRASGERLGITGTRAFFINGRFVTGLSQTRCSSESSMKSCTHRSVVNAAAAESTRR